MIILRVLTVLGNCGQQFLLAYRCSLVFLSTGCVFNFIQLWRCIISQTIIWFQPNSQSTHQPANQGHLPVLPFAEEKRISHVRSRKLQEEFKISPNVTLFAWHELAIASSCSEYNLPFVSVTQWVTWSIRQMVTDSWLAVPDKAGYEPDVQNGYSRSHSSASFHYSLIIIR